GRGNGIHRRDGNRRRRRRRSRTAHALRPRHSENETERPVLLRIGKEVQKVPRRGWLERLDPLSVSVNNRPMYYFGPRIYQCRGPFVAMAPSLLPLVSELWSLRLPMPANVRRV